MLFGVTTGGVVSLGTPGVVGGGGARVGLPAAGVVGLGPGVVGRVTAPGEGLVIDGLGVGLSVGRGMKVGSGELLVDPGLGGAPWLMGLACGRCLPVPSPQLSSSGTTPTWVPSTRTLPSAACTPIPTANTAAP